MRYHIPIERPFHSSASLSLAKSSNTILSSSSSAKLFWYFIRSVLFIFFNAPLCGCLAGTVESSDAAINHGYAQTLFVGHTPRHSVRFIHLDSDAWAWTVRRSRVRRPACRSSASPAPNTKWQYRSDRSGLGLPLSTWTTPSWHRRPANNATVVTRTAYGGGRYEP